MTRASKATIEELTAALESAKAEICMLQDALDHTKEEKSKWQKAAIWYARQKGYLIYALQCIRCYANHSIVPGQDGAMDFAQIATKSSEALETYKWEDCDVTISHDTTFDDE